MRRDEGLHHRGASLVLHHVDAHPPRAQQILLSPECLILPDDDVSDAVEENRAAAHRARRERRIHDAVSIDGGRSTACVLERVHLAMKDRATLLNAPIVSAPEDDTAMDERGADRNAALSESTFSFFNRREQKWIHAHQYL